MKRALILVTMMVCLLGLLVGCGSQGSGNQNLAKKDYGAPMDISLSAEEVEVHGVHLRLPDNAPLQQSNDDGKYYQTLVSLDDSLTRQVVVSIRYWPAEEVTHFSHTGEGGYTPEAALISWSDRMVSSTEVAIERTRIAGNDAFVKTYSEKAAWNSDVYECKGIQLPMNSGYVEIVYEDLGGRYGDLIQQSIDSIRIDEDEIPEIVRITSPENLKAAGLREQPWEFDCESFGIYLNIPEDYIPLKRDDGTFVWLSPDLNTMISAEVANASVFGQDAEAFKSMAAMAGIEEFEAFYSGPYRDMNCIDFTYRTTSDSGDGWVRMIFVAPNSYGEAIAITATSRSQVDAELPVAMSTLRYADGWNNGGVLDMEEIAVSRENQG